MKLLKMWTKGELCDSSLKDVVNQKYFMEKVSLDKAKFEPQTLQLIEKITTNEETKYKAALYSVASNLNDKLYIIEKDITSFAKKAIQLVKDTLIESVHTFKEQDIKSEFRNYVI